MTTYLCCLIGEDRKRFTKLHYSTVTRLKAFAIAMHIPLLMWGITGYLIAGRLFHLDDHDALLVAAFCIALIYMVERIVIATPKNGYVNAVRLLIGLIMAVIGASAVDLVIFQREIAQQLKMTGETVIHAEHDAAINVQRALAEKIRLEWAQRQASANCEANGTCGSGLRSLGPIYRQLVHQAEVLRQEYREADLKVTALESAKAQALEDWRASDRATQEAGLLARIQALHDYTLNNAAAAAAWLLFFFLMLFFELTVVLVKLAFGSSVDDHIEMVREQLSHHRASTYLDAVTSPTAAARQLMSTAT